MAASAPAPAPAKVYAVGTDAAYAPFESQNEKGEIVGLTADMVAAISAKACCRGFSTSGSSLQVSRGGLAASPDRPTSL